MNFLLDTNVVSELRRKPDAVNSGVLEWARQLPAHQMHISVVTVLEIELGIARIERRDQRQGAVLRAWMDEGVLAGFAGRIVPIDTMVGQRTARLHVPDPLPERDAYIAGTADVHDMTVVTRNHTDFEATGVAVLNPWS